MRGDVSRYCGHGKSKAHPRHRRRRHQNRMGAAAAEPARLLRQGVLPASNLQLITDEALARLFSVLPARTPTHVGAFLAATATEEDRRRLRGLAERAWPGRGSPSAAIATRDWRRRLAMATASRSSRAPARRCMAAKANRSRRRAAGASCSATAAAATISRVQGLRLVLTHYDLNQKITPLAEEILRTLALNRLPGPGRLGDAGRQDERRPARARDFSRRETRRAGDAGDGAGGRGVLADFTRAVAQRLDFPTRRCG